MASSSEDEYVRQVMNADIAERLAKLDPPRCSAVEVSGGLRRDLGWAFYTQLTYPDFDLTAPPGVLPGPFDVVICEQVLEHVADPDEAVRTLYSLTAPGGVVLVSTPFLLRVHRNPSDYWRFTVDGLRLLLIKGGFRIDSIRSWGNRTAVITNLFGGSGWTPAYRWLPRRSRDAFPTVIWAFATHP